MNDPQYEVRYVEPDECYRVVACKTGIAEDGDYETEGAALEAIHKRSQTQKGGEDV